MKSLVFTPDSVRSMLLLHKTQSRRLIMPQPRYVPANSMWKYGNDRGRVMYCEVPPPQYLPGIAPFQPGDLLYVRENCWMPPRVTPPILADEYVYDADILLDALGACKAMMKDRGWWRRSSRYMPKRAARLVVRIEDVRAMLLMQTTEHDAAAEGVVPSAGESYTQAFAHLWNTLHPKEPYGEWWVYAYTFSVVATTHAETQRLLGEGGSHAE